MSDSEVDFTPSAYEMYHTFDTGESSLTFSFIDSHLSSPQPYPLSCLVICGTHAPDDYQNYLHLMKLSGLTSIKDTSDPEEEEEEEKPPELNSVSIPHHGVVNRLKTCCVFNCQLVSSFSSDSCVYLYDISQAQNGLQNQSNSNQTKNAHLVQPSFVFHGHSSEGYALDWSKSPQTRMLSGDCSGQIFLWELSNNGQFVVNSLQGCRHADSVEDIQWSSQDPSVFASCSVDRSIKMWDIRNNSLCLDIAGAHSADVNVISLHPTEPVIVSGGDEGELRVWDVRSPSLPLRNFIWYEKPVTSVEWNWSDPSVFVASSEGNSISIWDYEAELVGEDEGIVPQILFEHKGMDEVKEVHWWRGLAGVVGGVGRDGFDIFKSISA